MVQGTVGGAYVSQGPNGMELLSRGVQGVMGRACIWQGKSQDQLSWPSIMATMPPKTSAAPSFCSRHHLCFHSARVPCRVGRVLSGSWVAPTALACVLLCTKCPPSIELTKRQHRQCESPRAAPASQPLDSNPREGKSTSLPLDRVKAHEKLCSPVTAHATGRSLKFQTSRTWV